ncbi:hypothetical protein AMAG_19991 [Allomyces macrogynus ATCC 38327]|uniref:Uncharacterized protein n=1 Tax=Allomyces macrogynus (strain ATCC 38327) TaxID=578462 RepID=A0A0L0T4T5_ALLM3|nr:hypothetical protein AMAG_19991 [Allomyces macrogynus ATCC 38327]|eukprot:KNE69539.1 hypothetical protein AMAG_19991 [Allomyces macrogynus ATCC 38327]
MPDPAITNTPAQPAIPLDDTKSQPADTATAPPNAATAMQPPPPTYSSVPPPLPSSDAYPQAASAGDDGAKPAARTTAPATRSPTDGPRQSSACSSCMWFYNCSALGYCCGWCCVECVKCFSS